MGLLAFLQQLCLGKMKIKQNEKKNKFYGGVKGILGVQLVVCTILPWSQIHLCSHVMLVFGPRQDMGCFMLTRQHFRR